MDMEPIQIAELKARASLVALIGEVVSLMRQGAEYIGLCPFHNEKTPSFTVYRNERGDEHYKCFACGAGGDHFDWLEHQGFDFSEALEYLRQRVGESPLLALPTTNRNQYIFTDAPPNESAPTTIWSHKAQANRPVVTAWPYRDQYGHLLGYACRVDIGDKKEIIPVRWTAHHGWRQKALDVPRPLYGVERLTPCPQAKALLVEGEKTTEAGRRLMAANEIEVVTWPGGCKATAKVDWTPLTGRQVVCWPDNDQPGMSAMLVIADKLEVLGARVRIVRPDPSWPDNYDLADLEADGWTHNDVMNYLHDNLYEPDDLRTEPADEASSQHDEAPLFIAEMPKNTRASYFNQKIQPQPLPLGLPSAMSWDDELLPEALRGFVRDTADRTQCPPDFVAVALVVATGALVGRKFTIHPKQRDDWEVVPNQWGCIIGRPSAMKSPALRQALRPLTALEAEEREKHGQAMNKYKVACDIQELERKASKAKAKTLIADGTELGRKAALTELANCVNDIPKPTQRRLVINDATVEKAGELLNQNKNGLLLVRDELAGWLAFLQDEDGAVARAFYLECFEGSGQFTYDRIGRGTIFIESCCLSVIGGIQPSRIIPLVRSAVTGEFDDGLIQRLQIAVWPDDICDWQLVDRWPNQAARERVESVFRELDQIPDDPRHALRFTAEAQELFNVWYTDHMQELRRNDVHPALQAHFMKMPQTIVGLALLFELIGGGRESVGVEATTRALGWANYLKSHAGRLYGAAINAPVMGAQLILERKGRLPEPFTPREIVRKGWAGLGSIESVNDALTILSEHHLVISYEVSGEKGGRPSTRYVWRRAL